MYIRNGDMLSHIEYQTDPQRFNLNFPVFMDMVASYNIAPISGGPIGVDPVCDTDPSFICGLSPRGVHTVSPTVSHLFSELINVESLGHP